LTDVARAAEIGEPVAGSDTPGTIATYSIDQQLAVLIDTASLLVPANLTP
jgi:hypothetical protein